MRKSLNRKIFVSLAIAVTLWGAVISSTLTSAQYNQAELDDPNQFDLQHLRADDQETYSGKNLNCGHTVSKIGCFIVNRLVNILIALIGIVSIGIITMGGFTLVTAAGNDTRLQKGKDMILYAIIGLVVAISAYVITIFVQSVFYQ